MTKKAGASGVGLFVSDRIVIDQNGTSSSSSESFGTGLGFGAGAAVGRAAGAGRGALSKPSLEAEAPAFS